MLNPLLLLCILYYYNKLLNFIIVPPINVRITKSEVIPTAGQNYSLTCTVSGIETSTYQWMKNGTTLHETGSTLYFTPMKLSDAGKYFCGISFSTWTFNDSIAVSIQSKRKYIEYNHNYIITIMKKIKKQF